MNTAVILLVFLTGLGACQGKEQPRKPIKTPVAELEMIIKDQVDSLYEVYANFDYDWIEFYADEYTAVSPNTPIRKMRKDSLRGQWEKLYKKYRMKLISRGTPSIIVSEDMAISANSFDEIFVDKETNDTTRSRGTYTVGWKRQADDSWKIVFESVHNN